MRAPGMRTEALVEAFAARLREAVELEIVYCTPATNPFVTNPGRIAV